MEKANEVKDTTKFEVKYVELKAETKAPKNLNKHLTPEELEKVSDAAILIPEGIVLVDVDNADEGEVFLTICQMKNIDARIVKTTRGYHFYFKNTTYSKKLKSTSHNQTSIGITVDIKNGTSGKVMGKIKQDGKMREVIQDVEYDKLAPFPKWLKVFKGTMDQGKENMALAGLKSGDGRNEIMFKFPYYLAKHGMKVVDEMQECMDIVNSFVFAEPLPEEEFEHLCGDDLLKKAILHDLKDNSYRIGNKLCVDAAVKDIVIDLGLVTHDTVVYRKEGLVYRPLEDGHLKSIIKKGYVKDGAPTELCTIVETLKISTNIKCISVGNENLKFNPDVIACQNAIYNLKTSEITTETGDSFVMNQLGAYYDPTITSDELLENTLTTIFDGDKDVIRLWWQMVGCCLTNDCRHEAMFSLWGEGSNGKSTLMQLLECFLGEENVTHLSHTQFGQDFLPGTLYGKLANLNYDSPKGPIQATDIIKKVVSGDPITVNRKNREPVEMKLTAKLILATNHLLTFSDHSSGFISRIVTIPFLVDFERRGLDVDDTLKDRLKNPHTLSYMLNMAIKGLQDLRQNNFVNPAVCATLKDRTVRANSSVLSWMDEEEYKAEDLAYKPPTPATNMRDAAANKCMNKNVTELFEEYVKYCALNKCNPYKSKNFREEILRAYPELKVFRPRAPLGTPRPFYFAYKDSPE